MSDQFARPELPALGILASMPAEDRALLSNYGEFIPAHPGTTIIVQGNAQDSLYFVISGTLHVTTEVEGRPTLIARVAAGETIGEVNVFDPGVASANVVAKEFSQIWRASRVDLDAFIAAYPEAAAPLLTGLLTCLCHRIRRMNERLVAHSSVSAAAQWLH